jgi:hypothetical protein
MQMNQEIQKLLTNTKQLIGWENASSPAKMWWKELESVNSSRIDLVVELAEELATRGATLDDFFMVCCYSGKSGVKSNLRVLDTLDQDQSLKKANSKIKRSAKLLQPISAKPVLH